MQEMASQGPARAGPPGPSRPAGRAGPGLESGGPGRPAGPVFGKKTYFLFIKLYILYNN